MNYQQVKQYLTIVKHMNLSKAAEELYISQPALSLALGRLESELDVQLFYREGKKLIISPAGEHLYHYFKELKDAHDRLTQAAAEFRQNEGNSFITIGFSVSTLFFSALSITGNFDSFQSVGIKKLFGDEEQVLAILKNGMIDFAVTCPPIIDDQVTNQILFSEQYILVVSSGHPFASRKSISIADLKNIELTGLNRYQPTRLHNDQMFQEYHFTPVYAHELDYPDYYAAIKECAYTDHFANLIPESFFEKTYGNGYVAIPFSDDTMIRRTAISWLTEKKYNLEHKELFDYIIQEIQSQRKHHQQFSREMFSIH